MQNSETELTIEQHIVPESLYAAGVRRCFVYRGQSMSPTFRPGHVLYVRPTAQDIQVGDVIVFLHPTANIYYVHRVVSKTQGGWITRGDNNPFEDSWLVTPEDVVGRVEVMEDLEYFKPVKGGNWGTWQVKKGRMISWLGKRLRPVFRFFHHWLFYSPKIRWALQRIFVRQVKVIHLNTPDGVLIKTLYRGQTISRWWPETNRFECRIPYDLIIPTPAGVGYTW